MNDDELIDVISFRITAEHRKHSQNLPEGWARIAACKIMEILKDNER